MIRPASIVAAPTARPRAGLQVVALALGIGALGVWWPRLRTARRAVRVLDVRTDVAIDADVHAEVVRVAREAARRTRRAGLAVPERQLVLLCRTRACWRSSPAPHWSRATTRLLNELVVLSPYVPLGPVPAAAPARPGALPRPAYRPRPRSRHACAC